MLSEVEAYWQALRTDGDVPRRADLDPRGIEGALPYAFIVERIAPGVARLRLAGRHVNDLMGMEVRGMPLTAFFESDARKDLAMRLEEMFQTPGILMCDVVSRASLGKPGLEGRLMLLPLKSDLGDVSRAIGVLVTQGEIGTSPRRFSVSRSELKEISALDATAPRQSEGASEDSAEEVDFTPAAPKLTRPARPGELTRAARRLLAAVDAPGPKTGKSKARAEARTEVQASRTAPADDGPTFKSTQVPFLRVVHCDD